MSVVRVGTRGSRLALVQAEEVAQGVSAARPDWKVSLSVIKTKGDRNKEVILGPQLGQRFFTAEIEEALRRQSVDLAVHSLKDLSTQASPGLTVAAFLRREDRSDVLVTSDGGCFDELPEGAKVGTSSPRRALFLKEVRPDLKLRAVRGNVPTRVRLVDDGTFDAVVLAAAGLIRLSMEDRIAYRFPEELLPPAGGQGIVGVQAREGEEALLDSLQSLDHPESRVAGLSERAGLRRLRAGCQAPVCAAATVSPSELRVDLWLWTPDGILRECATGSPDVPEEVGERAANSLLNTLGLDSLEAAPWTLEAPEWLRL